MAEMPGFMQLQAQLRDPALKLDQEATWRQLASDDLKRVQEANWWHRYAGDAQDAAYEWGVPPQAVLDRACALRKTLDAQVETTLKPYVDRTLLVVGRAKFTPDGYELGAEGFNYLDATDGGDGRVPLWSALLPGVRTWKLDCEHGSLPDAEAAFEAYAELLVRGDTAKLDRLALPAAARGAARGGAAGAQPATAVKVRSRPSRARPSALPADTQASVFALGSYLSDAGAAPEGAALHVKVLNGNLTFIKQPLLVGHTRSLTLTGTEAVVDKLIGGAMTASLDAGLYPDLAGSHQIFLNSRPQPDNPWAAPQPSMVVVVGLGDEGKLSEQDLCLSVRQGVIAWAQRTAEGGGAAAAVGSLAATLIGSGGVGMHAGNAARAIAQGVRDANDRLRTSGWPLVGELTLVELYLERASDAWHGLKVLATAAPGRFEIAPTILSGMGPLRRQIDSGYRGADYDYIVATSPVPDTIEFALDTKRARTEVRANTTQGKLLRELVARASTASSADPRLGGTLFQLLVPTAVEPFLAGTNQVLLELDDATAAIPWELLDAPDDGRARSDERPWAIRSQLLRKLRQNHYRQAVQDASVEDAVLVIGSPLVDESVYPDLPGARSEAQAVMNTLSGPGGLSAQRVNLLVDEEAAGVINALFERRYRIVHVAGHGEPAMKSADGKVNKGGVVLSGGTFLGSDEIRSMRTVPELVFVNCCHLAARDSGQALNRPAINRAEFAWGVADSLIEIGVRCVIAAGWAVDDGPAEVFASTFYREILARKPFVTAVATAREAAWLADRNSNTWAAYQAYGDPNWSYRRDAGDKAAAPRPPQQEYEGVASPLGLALALEELAVKSKFMRADSAGQLERVRHLEARFAPLWGAMGAVAEAFGLAYAEAGDRDAAITWFERAMAAPDGSASMKTQETLANLHARRGWDRARAVAGGENGPARRAALDAAREEIDLAQRGLEALCTLLPTVERHCLCGSTLKRLGRLEAAAGDARAATDAMDRAAQAYRRAEDLARTAGDQRLYYPALNRMALELVAHGPEPAWPGYAPADSQAARDSLERAVAEAPSFEAHAGLIEIDLLQALARRQLVAARGGLTVALENLHTKATAPQAWESMADQAELVLGHYIGRSAAAEREAAQALLDSVQAWAGRRAAPAA